MIVRMTLLALVVLATAACPPRTTSTLAPNAVLERYAKAVKAGDFDAVLPDLTGGFIKYEIAGAQPRNA